MKSYFTKVIKSADDAYTFYTLLAKGGLLFHPEDSAQSVVNSLSGEPLFTEEEAMQLNARVAESYDFLNDPCEFCLGLCGGSNAGSSSV